MSNSKNQAAESTTAAGATSADEIKTAAQADDTREFLRVYRMAGRRDRAMIRHMLQAYAAGSRRSVIEWAYHWAAFVAVNPRAAYRVTPTLRRIAQISMILAAVGVMLLLSACSGADGRSVQDLRVLAGMTPQPAPTVAQISATETPDLQPMSTVLPTTQPAQIVDATQTPQPVAQIIPACDAAQPMPTVALDAQDVAAGVLMRGQWQPCAYQTAVAVQAVQP